MHTGGTPENPLCIRCTSGVHSVYTLWEPLWPGGFAEDLGCIYGVGLEIRWDMVWLR
jgi:hypothetical protein